MPSHWTLILLFSAYFPLRLRTIRRLEALHFALLYIPPKTPSLRRVTQGHSPQVQYFCKKTPLMNHAVKTITVVSFMPLATNMPTLFVHGPPYLFEISVIDLNPDHQLIRRCLGVPPIDFSNAKTILYSPSIMYARHPVL